MCSTMLYFALKFNVPFIIYLSTSNFKNFSYVFENFTNHLISKEFIYFNHQKDKFIKKITYLNNCSKTDYLNESNNVENIKKIFKL